MNISQLLDVKLTQAMKSVGIADDAPAVIKPSGRPEFGDYQANGMMGAAKKLKTNPRQLADQVVEALKSDNDGVLDTIEVAGPGFINLHLNKAWLSQQLESALQSERLAVEQASSPQKVVVDYSAPNLAKEMHVGHLRSTIIGDAMVRTLDFLGHSVIRQNHVGDWGTQFGMLLAHLADVQAASTSNDAVSVELSDLETFYRASKQRFDNEADFAERARNNVVKLQSGDEACLALWTQFIDISLQHCDQLYRMLNVLLERDDVMPESAYNDDLANVVSDLDKQGLLTQSDGAQCVFLDEFKGKDGDPLPIIVQKSDGGYLYATTDLAALRYRENTLNAERVLYFVDARQNLHLQQVFAVGRKAGFVSEAMQLEHMPFGTMMGKDGKPFKTRSGDTVKLHDLLEEAKERALALVTEKNKERKEHDALTDDELKHIGDIVGISSVKYADLSKSRTSDYIFNWDTMLSFEGNTAPYLQYAYARIQSIFRKAENPDTGVAISLNDNHERALAIKLLQFTEAVEMVAKDGTPSTLCTYLHELSGLFMTFYEACPILKADVEADTRNSRLKLAQLTANTLKTGLDLLGIKTMDRM